MPSFLADGGGETTEEDGRKPTTPSWLWLHLAFHLIPPPPRYGLFCCGLGRLPFLPSFRPEGERDRENTGGMFTSAAAHPLSTYWCENRQRVAGHCVSAMIPFSSRPQLLHIPKEEEERGFLSPLSLFSPFLFSNVSLFASFVAEVKPPSLPRRALLSLSQW